MTIEIIPQTNDAAPTVPADLTTRPTAAERLGMALQLAKWGHLVFPVYGIDSNGNCACGNHRCKKPGKHPLTKHGLKDATTDPEQIKKWWKAHPDANIGMRCDGLLVLDVDPRSGGTESFYRLQNEHDRLPETTEQQTGSGGTHLIFKLPENAKGLPDKVPGYDGLDLRSGDGRYIVVAPSFHSSGKRYRWTEPIQPSVLPPDWLMALITKDSGTDGQPGPRMEVPESIHDGERNTTLYRLACKYRADRHSDNEILAFIDTINRSRCDPPLEPDELQSIVESATKHPPGHSLPVQPVNRGPQPPEVQEWNNPVPLPTMAPDVPSLPPGLLPKRLRDWSKDAAERLQVTLEFVAVPALVALSSVVGRSALIHPKKHDDWCVTPNLWGGIVGRPATLKSPAITEGLRYLDELSSAAGKAWENQKALNEAGLEAHRAQVEALKQKMRTAAKAEDKESLDSLTQELAELNASSEAVAPSQHRYRTNDSTVEKLGELVRENPRGLLVYRDELSGWIRTFQKQGREGDREFFLEAWNGNQPFDSDRIGRGSIHIEALCLSILGGIQPAKLDRLVSDAIAGNWGDDGLMQRLQLLVYPETPKEWENVDREPDLRAREQARAVFQEADQLAQRFIASGESALYRFSPDAQAMFNDWIANLMRRLRSGEMHPALESHLSKYRSLMPSLALLLHLANRSHSDSTPNLPVSLDAAQKAAAWCDFLEPHARKVYAGAIQPDLQSAYALLEKIREGRVRDGMSCRSIYRHHWASLESSEAVEAALEVLEECGYVRQETQATDGRPSTIVRIHPNLIKENSHEQ